MPRDVATRWNSTFDMLAFAVKYRSAINDITAEKNANLRKYELDNDEWLIALQLHDTLKVCCYPFLEINSCPHCFLIVSSLFPHCTLQSLPTLSTQIFKDATLFFSRSTPNLVTVIPAMDHIDETLTNNSLDLGFEPSIHAALGIAKKTLNRYYNATDQSEVYRIAMGKSLIIHVLRLIYWCLNYSFLVLHPCHKLKYFECAGWEPDWIRTAEDIVRAVFEGSYAAPSSNIHDLPPPVIEKHKVHFNYLKHIQTLLLIFSQVLNIFDNLPVLAPPRRTELRDELARYLSTDLNRSTMSSFGGLSRRPCIRFCPAWLLIISLFLVWFKI